MTIVLIPVLILAAVAVVGVLALRSWGQRRTVVDDELAGDSPTLDYLVPPGQDPAALMAALQEDGYQAAPDPRRTDLLHIACPTGLDRERPRVRATLESAERGVSDDSPTGPVRFVDEA
jgi:hypothetical protein